MKTITIDWSQKGTKVTRNMSKCSVCDTKSCQLVSSHNPIPPKVTTTSRRVRNGAGRWHRGHEKPATGISSCQLGSFPLPASIRDKLSKHSAILTLSDQRGHSTPTWPQAFLHGPCRNLICQYDFSKTPHANTRVHGILVKNMCLQN